MFITIEVQSLTKEHETEKFNKIYLQVIGTQFQTKFILWTVEMVTSNIEQYQKHFEAMWWFRKTQYENDFEELKKLNLVVFF
jgi:hypothetical protein